MSKKVWEATNHNRLREALDVMGCVLCRSFAGAGELTNEYGSDATNVINEVVCRHVFRGSACLRAIDWSSKLSA